MSKATPKEDIKPWDRQPNESAKQYDWFRFYCELPASERGVAQVIEHSGKSRRHVEKTRSSQKWISRAAARDEYMANETDDATVRALLPKAFDYIRWEQDNLNDYRTISDQLKIRCQEMLDIPITETIETITETTEDGKTIHKTIVRKPLNIRPADIPKFIEASIILARFVIEQSGVGRPITGGMSLPKPPKDIEEMSQDERQEYIDQLRAAKEEIERGEFLN